MPQVELLQSPSMAPPMMRSTYVYLSSFGLDVGPNHLLGRPRGEPSGHDIARAFASTIPILRRQCL
jgi:hypothetical protein